MAVSRHFASIALKRHFNTNFKKSDLKQFSNLFAHSSALLQKNIAHYKERYNSLNQDQRQSLFKRHDIDRILQKAPKALRGDPNLPLLILALSDALSAPKLQKLLKSSPLRQMETNLKMVSHLEDGVRGFANWRNTFIGGHLDEYSCNAPEFAVSPWHDIGLSVKSERDADAMDNAKMGLQMVVTIPQKSLYCNRVAKDERLNPIRHVLNRAGVARRLPCRAPFHFGVLPQTWDDPRELCSVSGKRLSDGLLMAVDISGCAQAIGVSKVKLLGSLGAVSRESGRIQWVMVCCNMEDPLAKEIDDIADADLWIPGVLGRVRGCVELMVAALNDTAVELFRQGEFQNMETTYTTLLGANNSWHSLITKRTPLPKTYYVHHPLMRNGEMMSIESEPTYEERTSHALGLSLEDRVAKRWKSVDHKTAYFKSRYFEHVASNERRKVCVLLSALSEVAPHAVPALAHRMRHIELANPPPSKTGSKLIFEERERSEENKIKRMVAEASKAKMEHVKGEEGLLGAPRKQRAEGSHTLDFLGKPSSRKNLNLLEK